MAKPHESSVLPGKVRAWVSEPAHSALPPENASVPLGARWSKTNKDGRGSAANGEESPTAGDRVTSSLVNLLDTQIAHITRDRASSARLLAQLQHAESEAEAELEASRRKLEPSLQTMKVEVDGALSTLQRLGSSTQTLSSVLDTHLQVSASLGRSLSLLEKQHIVLTAMQQYTRLVKEVEDVSEEARVILDAKSSRTNILATVDSFSHLAGLLIQVHELGHGTGGSLQKSFPAARNLARVLEGRIEYLRSRLSPQLASLFKELLKEVHWPKTKANALTVDPNVMQPFCHTFEGLVKLQLAESSLLSTVSLSAKRRSPGQNEYEGGRMNASSGSDEKVAQEEKEVGGGATVTGDDEALSSATPPPLVLNAVKMLLAPILMRFKYHFEGDRSTNRLDKPEWYFSFALAAIEDHSEFVDTILQPQVTRLARLYPALRKIDVLMQLMRGIVDRLVAKMERELPLLTGKPEVFQHTVDEALLFENKLRGALGYESTLPACVTCLMRADLFEAWIETDQRYVKKRLKGILSETQTPWAPLVAPSSTVRDEKKEARVLRNSMDSELDLLVSGSSNTTGNADSNLFDMDLFVDDASFPTVSSDAVVMLQSDISERYALLPKLLNRLACLESVQLRVLNDYLKAIEAKFRDYAFVISQGVKTIFKAPSVWRDYCGLLSSLQHVETVLRDWSDSDMYLQLQFFKKKREEAGAGQGGAGDGESEYDEWTPSDAVNHPDFVHVSGSLFDQVIQDFASLRLTVLTRLVNVLEKTFFNETASYRRSGHLGGGDMLSGGQAGRVRDNAQHHDSGDEEDGDEHVVDDNVEVSRDIAKALTTLREELGILSESLSAPQFREVWKTLAAQLSLSLFKEVVMHRYFSAAGCKQFLHDTDMLFTLFRKYTEVPQNFFKHLKEARIVIQMDDETRRALQNTVEHDTTARARQAIAQHGIRKFSVRQVKELLEYIRPQSLPDSAASRVNIGSSPLTNDPIPEYDASENEYVEHSHVPQEHLIEEESEQHPAEVSYEENTWEDENLFEGEADLQEEIELSTEEPATMGAAPQERSSEQDSWGSFDPLSTIAAKHDPPTAADIPTPTVSNPAMANQHVDDSDKEQEDVGFVDESAHDLGPAPTPYDSTSPPPQVSGSHAPVEHDVDDFFAAFASDKLSTITKGDGVADKVAAPTVEPKEEITLPNKQATGSVPFVPQETESAPTSGWDVDLDFPFDTTETVPSPDPSPVPEVASAAEVEEVDDDWDFR